jgi:hypothetical protein
MLKQLGWKALGRECEIKNCGSPAYQKCDQSLGAWSGCAMAMCLNHVKVKSVPNIKKGEKDIVLGYHCVGTECEKEYRKARGFRFDCEKCGKFCKELVKLRCNAKFCGVALCFAVFVAFFIFGKSD